MIELTDDFGDSLPEAPTVAPRDGFVAQVGWANRTAAQFFFFEAVRDAEEHLIDPNHKADIRFLPTQRVGDVIVLDCTAVGCVQSVAVLRPIRAGERFPALTPAGDRG